MKFVKSIPNFMCLIGIRTKNTAQGAEKTEEETMNNEMTMRENGMYASKNQYQAGTNNLYQTSPSGLYYTPSTGNYGQYSAANNGNSQYQAAANSYSAWNPTGMGSPAETYAQLRKKKTISGLIFLALGIISFIIAIAEVNKFTSLENQAMHVYRSGGVDAGSGLLAVLMFILSIVFLIIGIVKLARKPKMPAIYVMNTPQNMNASGSYNYMA